MVCGKMVTRTSTFDASTACMLATPRQAGADSSPSTHVAIQRAQKQRQCGDVKDLWNGRARYSMGIGWW